MADAASILLLILAASGVAAAFMFRARIRDVLHDLRKAAAQATTSTTIGLVLYQQNRPQPKLPQPDGPSPFAVGKWVQIGGDGMGWEGDTFYKVRGLAWHKGYLFASLTGPKSDGPRGDIQRWDGERWLSAGRGGTGPLTGDPCFVDHLTSFGDHVYAAGATGIWRYQEDEWENVTGRLPVSEKGSAYSFCVWRGRLVTGFWGRPMVAAFDGTDWAELPPPAGGWGQAVRTIYCLAEFKGDLYAGTGTGKFNGPPSAVWRYDGHSWEQVAGAGLRGSWIQDGIPFVLSLTVFGEHLVATLSRPPGTPLATSNVWAFDGDEWMPVAPCRTPDLMARSLIMNDAIAYNGRLIVATGDGTHRHAQLWELGAAGQWADVGGHSFLAPATESDGGYWIYRLCSNGSGGLFAGTAGHKGAARVFQFQATTTHPTET